jgi:hypothetical protein
MAERLRGRVTKLTVETEYPDGSKKTTVIDDIAEFAAIIADPSLLSALESKMFTVSEEDWAENPSFILFDYPDFESAAEPKRPRPKPFCSSLQCK